jgi:hypothetical protein
VEGGWRRLTEGDTELGGGGVEVKLSYKEMELEGRGARRKGSKGS